MEGSRLWIMELLLLLKCISFCSFMGTQGCCYKCLPIKHFLNIRQPSHFIKIRIGSLSLIKFSIFNFLLFHPLFFLLYLPLICLSQ